MRSYIFVIIQILLLGILLFFGDVFPNHILLYIPWVSGLILILWSFIEKKMSVSIFPTPHKGMNLVRSGPYKYIRHPIYTGVLLFTFSWLPLNENYISYLILWIALAILFLLKISYEESFLMEEFVEYGEYSKHTKKLIPYIF